MSSADDQDTAEVRCQTCDKAIPAGKLMVSTGTGYNCGQCSTAPGWPFWLAFHAGRIVSTPHGLTSGRDAMRELRARFDQMGAPEEAWAPLERAALQDNHPIALAAERVARRVVEYLAGGKQPIGPLDRIRS